MMLIWRLLQWPRAAFCAATCAANQALMFRRYREKTSKTV
jgi:hypothetical protein